MLTFNFNTFIDSWNEMSLKVFTVNSISAQAFHISHDLRAQLYKLFLWDNPTKTLVTFDLVIVEVQFYRSSGI